MNLGKQSLTVLVAIGLVLLAPGRADAQGGSGAMIGNVLDQNGMPIKGVKISARSDTQIGGAKVVYSSDEGSFRIMGLIPGEFEVTATAPKLKTVIQKGINVGLNAPAEIDLIMEVETKVEEVKVIAKAPIVSTTTAQIKEVFDEEFIDNIPVGTKTAAESTVADMTPGVVRAGTSVRAVRMRGGASNASSFQVDGFYMNGQASTLKAMAAIEVLSAGQGADNASASGGVVNMVTKSGSNKFEFDVNAYAQDNNLTFFRDPGERDDRSYYYMINPNLSGPIIRDRLWFFVNFEGRVQSTTPGPDPQGFFPQLHPSEYGSFRGSGKLTWQVTPRNKLASFNSFTIRKTDWNGGQSYGSYREEDAVYKENDRDIFTGLIWESLLSDAMFFKTQAGFQRFWNQQMPSLCDRNDDCLHIIPLNNTYPRTVRSQNYEFAEQRVEQKIQATTTVEYFPSTRHFGDHNIKLKVDYFTESHEIAETTPGDIAIQYNGQNPERRTEYFANDPRIETARLGWFIRNSSGSKVVVSLNDAWRATRYLTVTPGIAFTRGWAANSKGDESLDSYAFTPHMAVAYDPTHDGRTVLRGGFNGYVDVDAVDLARHTLGSRVTRQCPWSMTANNWDGNCTYTGGSTSATFGLPCGPTGVDPMGNNCRERLVIPRTWEALIGAEREIVQGVGVGVDLVYRIYRNQFEGRETNRIWNYSGTQLVPTGSYRNGKNQTYSDLGTPDGARRDYTAVTFSTKKREGRFKTSASYTWSMLKGTTLDGTAGAYGSNPGRDAFLNSYLDDDRRHNVKASITYQVTNWLNAGILYNYFSGKPLSRKYRNDVTGGFDDYRARVGLTPGPDLNDPGDDRPARAADTQNLNIQLRANLKPITGIYLDLYADVLNALALRTPNAYEENDRPSWGSVTGREGPMKVRLGFRYKY